MIVENDTWLTHKDLPKYQVVVDVSGLDNAMHVLVRDTTTGLTTVTRLNLPADLRRWVRMASGNTGARAYKAKLVAKMLEQDGFNIKRVVE